jgi:hypothetical protein
MTIEPVAEAVAPAAGQILANSQRPVVAAIAPICVDQFQRGADAAVNLTALKKTDSWQQAAYVEKGGWAVMPGSKAADSGVPQACAALLNSLK